MLSHLENLFASPRILYRSLGIVLVVLLPLGGWLEPVEYPRGFWDWFTLCVLVVLALILGISTFFRQVEESQLFLLFAAVVGAGSAYESAHIYSQNLGYLVVLPLFMNIAAVSVMLNKVIHVRLYIASAIIPWIITAHALDAPMIAADYFTVGMVAYGAFIYLVCASSITMRDRKKLIELNLRDKLERAQRMARIGGWEYAESSGFSSSISLKHLLGHTAIDELPSSQVFNTLPEFDLHRLQRSINDLVEGKHSEFEIQSILSTKLGEEIDVLILGQRLTDGSRIVSGTVQDISEQAEKARALRQAKEAAESATRMRAQFIANISHELRTPMNGVIGMTALLADSGLTSKQKELASIIEDSGKVLMSLVDEVLDFSKLESSEMQLECEKFDLKVCLTESLSVISAEAAQKKLNLIFDWDSELPLSYYGDKNRIRQVILNLLSNAVKFTEIGEVRLSISAADKKSKDLQPLEITVADTGTGIAPEKLKNVFEPFVQEDASTTRRFGGTGLGLTISRNLLEKMGGSISVVSELNAGSKFKIILALNTANSIAELSEGQNQSKSVLMLSESGPPQKSLINALESDGYTCQHGAIAAVPNCDTKNPKTLIVEDNLINQKVALGMLEKFGIRADIANNGREALDMITENHYDVVFMDLQMPVMDGLSATRAIRRESIIDQPIIIALTANAMPEDKMECLKAGMDEFMGKPLKMDDLRSILKSSL